MRGSEQTGVEGWRALELLHHLRAFVDDSIDGIARLAFRRLVDYRENPLEPEAAVNQEVSQAAQ
jgi:hypothetical protein